MGKQQKKLLTAIISDKRMHKILQNIEHHP